MSLVAFHETDRASALEAIAAQKTMLSQHLIVLDLVRSVLAEPD